MKRSLTCLLAMVGLCALADTRAIVPRGDGEGSIGDGTRAWGTGVFARATVRGVDGSLLPDGALGVNQVAQWNGTAWVAQAIGAPDAVPNVGTNVTRWTTTWPATNTLITTTTSCWFHLWGGPGSQASGSGAYAKGYWRGAIGTIFQIVIGKATGGTNAPGGGLGLGSAGHGGPYSVIYIDHTNIVLLAGGAGGGVNGATSYGGPGAGFVFGTANGTSQGVTTQFIHGASARALDEYGNGAAPGTNINPAADGSYMQGGNASTNGFIGGGANVLGGGGGGYYGGAGAARYKDGGASSTYHAGGGGSSYANSNYVSFVTLLRGTPWSGTTAVQPPGADSPAYTAGKALGTPAATPVDACGGVMY